MTNTQWDLSHRLLKFAAGVTRLVIGLPATLPARRIGDQLLRSATSAGANYEECRGAFSRPDFCNKLQISLKEMREALYWLMLMSEAGPCENSTELTALKDEGIQLRAILGKSTLTARRGKYPTTNNKP